jgi:hypothetical protein
MSNKYIMNISYGGFTDIDLTLYIFIVLYLCLVKLRKHWLFDSIYTLPILWQREYQVIELKNRSSDYKSYELCNLNKMCDQRYTKKDENSIDVYLEDQEDQEELVK